MTEISPFRGLRYDATAVSGSDVIAPPYDVVSEADVAALLAQSPYNIAHIESVPGTGDEKYTIAAEMLRSWEASGVLRRDGAPVYYAYEQRFAVPGQARTETRRVFFARLRLSAREDGIVRPHEATLSAAKEDRLNLLRATRTNVSPIFAMFADPTRAAIRDPTSVDLHDVGIDDGRRLGHLRKLTVRPIGPGGAQFIGADRPAPIAAAATGLRPSGRRRARGLPSRRARRVDRGRHATGSVDRRLGGVDERGALRMVE